MTKADSRIFKKADFTFVVFGSTASISDPGGLRQHCPNKRKVSAVSRLKTAWPPAADSLLNQTNFSVLEDEDAIPTVPGVGLSMTALLTLLLTLVALQLARSGSQSEVDYLTMIDKIYLASYGFIILVLLRVVRVSWRQDGAGNDIAIARTDRAWLLIVVVVYVAMLAAILATSLGS